MKPHLSTGTRITSNRPARNGWSIVGLLLVFFGSLLSQQAYAQTGATCNCTDYIYLNDVGDFNNTGFVHKFRANADGTLTEVPNGTTGTLPWFPVGGGLPQPHGLGQDLNGDVYIGQDSDGPIAKLTCNGTLLNANFIDDGGYNIDSRNGIVYINSHRNGMENRISAYKLCDGSLLGYILLNGVPTSNSGKADWGFEIADNGTFYASAFVRNGATQTSSYIYRFTPTLADFTAHTTYNAFITDTFTGTGASTNHSVFPDAISDGFNVWGITTDPSGNMYVVVEDRGSTPDRTYILKFNAAGTLVASTSEPVTKDNQGYEEARGILYYNGFLYLGAGPGGDCLAKVNASTLTYVGPAIGHVSGQNPKGIRLVRECCPIAATTVVDTTLCSAPVGTTLFLQNLIKGCGSPICGGNWAALAGNTGATYNACDNSITINQANVCASFQLIGGGGTSTCNSFTITVNFSGGSITGGTASPSQTICANTAPPNPLTVTGATATSAVSYQWQRSTTNCTTGFSNITGATSATYNPGVLTTTTYFRAITSAVAGCNLGTCRDTTNCVTITVTPAPTANLTSASICAGQTATLTATGGTSYTFSTGLVNTTGILTVSPTTTTPYSVTVGNASGCISTTTATVTVNPAPIAGLTSVSICVGQTATLTASGGTSYTFSTGLINTTGILTVNPTSTTPYSVTVANASGCVSTTTATVTVNPVPTAGLTSASICAGQMAMLTASGGTSYTFSTGDINLTGLLTVSPASTTPYSVTVANASGCRSTTTATVTVTPVPTLSVTGITCVGLTTFNVTFTATVGASISVNLGSVTGNTVTGVPSGQSLFITATLNSCSAAVGPISQNCQSNAASLGDFVFVDQNRDGIQQPGETPIPGVVVVLLDGTNTPIRSTTTNASGLYSFTGLTPGVPYSVSFVAPTGYTSTSALQGGDDTKDSDADPVTGQTRSVTLAPGENNPNLDAGFYTPTAGLGDYVFFDANKDGIQNGGDTPIAGVTVTLYINGTATTTTTTDATGFYSFTGLTPGNSTTYSVGFTTPAGYTATLQNAGGDDTKDSDADIVTGRTQSVTLAPGEFNPTLDAGYYLIPASLGDYVFFDTNKDGIQNGGDTPIAGVLVTLYTNGVASLTTTTDVNGLYSFTGLTPGNSLSYSVGFTAPSGLTATLVNQGGNDGLDSDADVITGRTQSVTLAPGENNPTLDAGFYTPTAGLGDYVFLDVNQNGLQDGGDTPISGVLVTLYTNGVASLTTLTDASGLYSFTGLTPGSSLSYSVGFGTPSGLTPTTANVGVNDAADSDADVVTGRTQSVTLANGEFNSTLDAGFLAPVAPIFDLALRKTLAAGQSTTLTAGSSVTFTITVFNQGNVTATAINLVDLIPVDLTLNDPNWTAVTSTTATLNTPIASLSAGASTTRNIVFTINAGASGPIVNRAEIASAQGGTDIDSSPDANPGNDAGGQPGSGADDATGGNGTGTPGGTDPTTDEDDSDPAFVMVLAATPPTLTLEKSVNLSVAQVGNVLTYSLVLTNTGSVSATTTVRDSLSGGSTYVPVSASAPAGTTFTPGTPESLWTVPSIAAGQSLTLTFQVRVDSTGILYNTASIPGDTAKVCTSVPIKLCPGDEYTLTAPAGRASYAWYRNGVLIAGATTNSLTVTQGGSYSLSVSGAGSSCPDFSCCPVIVEVDSLPVFTAVAIPATCLGNTPQANGRLVISGFNPTHTYQYSAEATFNPAASLSGAPQVIPAGGVLVSNLASPASPATYTVRVYNSSGCYVDQTVLLLPTVCGCPADVCVPYVIQQTKRPRRIGDPIR